MTRPITLSKLQTGNADLDRVQEHLREKLNPVLASLPSSADFRWMQVNGVDQTVADTWALQFRTTGTTWTTILSVTSAGQIVQAVWIAPTLLNSFAVFGGGFMAPGYMKDSIGFVHLRGLVTNTPGVGGGTAIFVLPAGYRPSATVQLTSFGETAGAPFRIRIDTSGNVTVFEAVAAAGVRWLDGSFDTRS